MYRNYKQSKQIYTHEIDIVNIINSMRQLKVLLRVILSQNQLKIIEFANYRSLSQNLSADESIAESVIKTDSKYKFDRLCNLLNIENEKLEGLSTDELDMLYEVLGIDFGNEATNTSNVTEVNLMKSKVFPMIESRVNV